MIQEIPRATAIPMNPMQIFLAVCLIRTAQIVARCLDLFDSS
jgi:hypothetical protein